LRRNIDILLFFIINIDISNIKEILLYLLT
jgi:hypothetical protein